APTTQGGFSREITPLPGALRVRSQCSKTGQSVAGCADRTAGHANPPKRRMSRDQRPARRWIARRRAKVDEPRLGCWMSQGQGLADAHAQSPQILGAKAGTIDPAGVLGATGLGRLA